MRYVPALVPGGVLARVRDVLDQVMLAAEQGTAIPEGLGHDASMALLQLPAPRPEINHEDLLCDP